MENVTNFCINAEIVASSQPQQTQRCCSAKVGRLDFLVRILILEGGDRFPSFIHLDISGFILRSQDGKQRRCDELYPPESRLEQREWPPMIVVVLLRRGTVATLLLRRGTRATLLLPQLALNGTLLSRGMAPPGQEPGPYGSALLFVGVPIVWNVTSVSGTCWPFLHPVVCF